MLLIVEQEKVQLRWRCCFPTTSQMNLRKLSGSIQYGHRRANILRWLYCFVSASSSMMSFSRTEMGRFLLLQVHDDLRQQSQFL